MPAAIIAGGAIGGALIGAVGANKAAQTQADAAREAGDLQFAASQRTLALQREMFEKGQEGLAPFKDVGTSAMYSLADIYGLPTAAGPGREASAGGTGKALQAFETFRGSPEYQIPFQQGIKAIEYSRAAQGGLQNPGTANELMKWGQGYAGSRLDGYIGKLLSIANIGQGAAVAGAGQSTQQGQIMGNTIMGGANAQAAGILGAGQANAAGTVGMTNAITGGIGSLTNNLAMYSMLNPSNSAFGGPTSLNAGNYGGTGGYMGGFF